MGLAAMSVLWKGGTRSEQGSGEPDNSLQVPFSRQIALQAMKESLNPKSWIQVDMRADHSIQMMARGNEPRAGLGHGHTHTHRKGKRQKIKTERIGEAET